MPCRLKVPGRRVQSAHSPIASLVASIRRRLIACALHDPPPLPPPDSDIKPLLPHEPIIQQSPLLTGPPGHIEFKVQQQFRKQLADLQEWDGFAQAGPRPFAEGHEIVVHGRDLLEGGVKPSFRAEGVGVRAESGGVEVGDPGVDAHEGLVQQKACVVRGGQYTSWI